MKRKLILLFAVVLLAQVPETMHFQGRFFDVSGDAYDGDYSVRFSIYDSETGGGVLWEETGTLSFNNGFMSHYLGSIETLPLGIFDGSTRYLEIAFDGSIYDRSKMITVPYAAKSSQADSASWAGYVHWDSIAGIPADLDADWEVTGDDMQAIPTGSVAIGLPPETGIRLNVQSSEILGAKAVVGSYSETGAEGWLGTQLYGAYGQFDSDNYGALGSSGYGIYARGEISAGYFEGNIDVTGNADIGGNIILSDLSQIVIDGDAGADDVLMAAGTGGLYWGVAPSSGVTSLNSLTGALNITGGTDIDVTESGGAITVSYTGSGGGTDDDWTIGTGAIYNLSDNVGIGTASPGYNLVVREEAATAVINVRTDDGFSAGTGDVYTRYQLGSGGMSPGSYIWSTGIDNSDGQKFKISGAMDNAFPGLNDHVTVQGNGYVGIGTTSPTTDLDIDGTIRIRGGSPDDGKVLTSDASGNATWETPTGGGTGDSDWAFLSGSTIADNIYRTGDIAVGIDDTRGHRLNVEIPVMSSPYLDHAAIHGALTTSGDGTVYGEGALAQKNVLDFYGYPKTADYIGVLGVIPASGGAGATNMAVYAWNENDNSLGENYGVYSVSNGTGGIYNYGLYAEASGVAFNYGVYAKAPDGLMDRAGYFEGDIELTGALWDNTGTAGASGNVLTSTGDGVVWLDMGSAGADADWIDDDADSEVYNMNDRIGIGTIDVDPSAQLEIASTERGVLIPRMPTGARDEIIEPADGLLIFNTSTDCFNYFIEDAWLSLCGDVTSQNKQIYQYIDGTPQRFENTTGEYITVTVKAWGGGGGGNGNDELDQGFGGGGGFVQADVSLAPGEYLDLEPAEGGPEGGGGGASIVTHSYDGIIMVAAGGGGAGACGGSPGPTSSHGGAGGGFVGEDGSDQHTSGTYDFWVYGGTGGTQTAAGIGGTAMTTRPGVSSCNGDNGGYLFGGNSYSRTSCSSTYYGGNRDDAGTGCSNGCGGSGGAGYFGGGGAGAVYTYRGGGGGGGSSYFSGWPDTREPHFTIGGTGQVAGNMHDPDYQFSAGLGGYPGTAGKDGLIVIIIE